MSFEEQLKKIEDSMEKKELNSFQKNETTFKHLALRASTDMISSLMVGSILGWGVDHILDSFPCGLIGGFLLGTIAGLWTIYKTLLRIDLNG